MKAGISMKQKKYLIAFCTLSFLAILLLFPKTSIAGAKSGLLLWFDIVLPTLLPFFILSNFIIRFQVTNMIAKLCYPLFGHLLHISKPGCYPVIIGMLSGYPVGAKSISDLIKTKQIEKKEGQYLLSFCNNASPMFITGFIAIQCLEQENRRYHFLFLIYISSLLTGFLYYQITKRIHSKKRVSYSNITVNNNQQQQTHSAFQIIDEAIMDSFEIITKVGGYIILFSILASNLSAISWIPLYPKLLLTGILEITTGAAIISHASINPYIKIVLVLSITAFGGFSSHFQTKSAMEGSGLSIRTYLLVKLLCSILTAILSICYLTFYPIG